MSLKIQKAIDALNTAFEADRGAISVLLSMRVPCNQALGDHPTVQVSEDAGLLSVGFIGLLNGAIEPITGQRVAAIYNGKVLLGFKVYNKESQDKSHAVKNAVERITYTCEEACTALGVSRTSLWRIEKRGLIKPVPGLRMKVYSIAAIKRLAEGEARA